jgi:hypothetical protein
MKKETERELNEQRKTLGTLVDDDESGIITDR